VSFSISYQLKCDGPGEDGKGCTEYSDLSLSREECVAWAEKCGWAILTKKHYCVACRQAKLDLEEREAKS
jgi:hypothetical protein